MVKELSELRALRTAHARLTSDYAHLAKLVAKATGATVGRAPGRPRGSGAGARTGAARRGKGGKRFRTSAAAVQKQYAALAAKAGKEWVTKDALCKAAGYKPAQVVAAWKRLMEGYTGADGKEVKPILESNGSRGLKGRYRRR